VLSNINIIVIKEIILNLIINSKKSSYHDNNVINNNNLYTKIYYSITYIIWMYKSSEYKGFRRLGTKRCYLKISNSSGEKLKLKKNFITVH